MSYREDHSFATNCKCFSY